eukprot:7885186-Pyramimonas_sp.AAC.3
MPALPASDWSARWRARHHLPRSPLEGAALLSRRDGSGRRPRRLRGLQRRLRGRPRRLRGGDTD